MNGKHYWKYFNVCFQREVLIGYEILYMLVASFTFISLKFHYNLKTHISHSFTA